MFENILLQNDPWAQSLPHLTQQLHRISVSIAALSDSRIAQFLRLHGGVWPYFPVSVLGIPGSLNTAILFISANEILLIPTLWPLTLNYRLFWNASLHVFIFYRSGWYLLLLIAWRLQEKVSSFELGGGTWRSFLWPWISSASISYCERWGMPRIIPRLIKGPTYKDK